MYMYVCICSCTLYLYIHVCVMCRMGYIHVRLYIMDTTFSAQYIHMYCALFRAGGAF